MLKKLKSLKWGSSNSFAKPKLPEEQLKLIDSDIDRPIL